MATHILEAMSGPTRILVVDDEQSITDFIALGLRHEGYDVRTAPDGQIALRLVDEFKPHLVVLDLMMPRVDGWQLCRALSGDRTRGIIILSARDETSDRIQGLELGADDYLVKPFEYPELAARVKALLRRSLKSTSDVLLLGGLCIDFSGQTARLHDVPLELTTFEYRVLEYLVRERARVVPKQELSDYLYPHDEDRDSNVLEVLVGRLRRKLDPDGTLLPIETLRGRGYRFVLR
jgi:two-component system, OmpR family, response regulator PhoP